MNLTGKDGVAVPHLISLDEKTKQLVSFPVADIHIDDVIKGVKLTAKQKDKILKGKPLYLEGMISKKDRPFNGEIQFNAFKGHIEFIFDKSKGKNQKQENTNTQTNKIDRNFRGKEFSDEQYNKIVKGETIFVSDFKTDAGKEYPGYAWFNKESGQLDFDFKNPNKSKKHDQQTTSDNKKQQNDQQQKSTPSKRKGHKV